MKRSGARRSHGATFWSGIALIALAIMLARHSYGGYLFSAPLLSLGTGLIVFKLAGTFGPRAARRAAIRVSVAALVAASVWIAALQVPAQRADATLAKNRAWTRVLPVGDVIAIDGTLRISTPSGRFMGISLTSGKTVFDVDSALGAGGSRSHPPTASLAHDGSQVTIVPDAKGTAVVLHRPDGSLAWQQTLPASAANSRVTALAADAGAVAIQACSPIDPKIALPEQCRVEAFDATGRRTWTGTYGNALAVANPIKPASLATSPVALVAKSWKLAIALDLATGNKTDPAGNLAGTDPGKMVAKYYPPRVLRMFAGSSTKTVGGYTVIKADGNLTVERSDGAGPRWKTPDPQGSTFVGLTAIALTQDAKAGPVLRDREPNATRIEVRSMRTGSVGLRLVATTDNAIPIDSHTALVVDGDAHAGTAVYTLYRAD